MKYKTSLVQDRVKKLLGVVALLSMIAFNTEAKADPEFGVIISSVVVTQVEDLSIWIVVSGYVIDDPDEGADGIPVNVVDEDDSYLGAYTEDCDSSGNFQFWFPFDAHLIGELVVLQATDWSCMYYGSDSFEYPSFMGP
jgi:hypothetical protein